MLNKLKNLLNKNKVDATIEYDSDEIVCRNLTIENDCSLVSELKEKQRIRNEILTDLNNMKSNYTDYENVKKNKFIFFLMTLENCGIQMGRDFKYYNDYSRLEWIIERNGLERIEFALGEFSDEEIIGITNEIIALKQRKTIIDEKENALKAVKKDIVDIKKKLGIE